MSHHFEKLPVAIDAAYLEPDVTERMVGAKHSMIAAVDQELRQAKCAGCDFTGWLIPNRIVSETELARLKKTAERLRNETDVLLVIGIGGSYLGARAVIEALADDPDRVVYAGQNISAHYMLRLKRQLTGKKVAVNVISKSGTTTEPAIAFRVMKQLLGDQCVEIIATTDARKGALRGLAREKGYESFVVPDDVGGRFSVLSAVGLLPIAYAGIDVDALVKGAQECSELCAATPDPLRNPAYFYAAARNLLYQQGFSVELLASFEPRLHFFAEWWKQLYGESEGKDHVALYPGSVDFTTDLHSMGQYIQEGRRILAETFLIVDEDEPSLAIPNTGDDSDELQYLAGEQVTYVNARAYEATARAHRDGGVPNMTIHLKRLDAHSLGALIYFFEIACAVSGLMLGVNPFNQPGVEAYKKIMFRLLGKPGHEKAESAGTGERFVSF